MHVKVAGGTGAGSRMHIVQVKAPWTCANGHLNAAHWNTCSFNGCREKRT